MRGEGVTTLRPRQYAAEIIKLKTRDERRAYLDTVPVEYRAMVEFYVWDWWARR